MNLSENIGAILVVIILLLVVAYLGFAVSGLIIAFSSHPVTGVIALIVNPLSPIIGIGDGIFGTNIAGGITEFIISL